MDTESTRTLFNAICTFKDKPRENRNADKNENDEIRKLRQVEELNVLVTAKKENRSENSSSASASEKSEIAELKEQVQLITAMISDMKMQSKPDRSTNLIKLTPTAETLSVRTVLNVKVEMSVVFPRGTYSE